MPFISQKDNRQRMQTYVPAKYIETPDFSEVFNASVGLAIDEGLSISRAFNNEMYRERDSRVKELGDAGFDVPKYINRAGKLDYDRLSRDTDDFIQTDTVLRERRNEKLRQRREYAEDVIERGSGYAQFFGMATGFMLDPINIATLPIATAGVAAKGLGVLASAMNVAGREAALATAAELAIQPLVYTHKLDIESPYSTDDALMAIGGAAIGGALLGGAAGGLAGYFRKVGQKSREAIEPDMDSPEDMAINALERVAEDIDAFREADIQSDERFAQSRARALYLKGKGPRVIKLDLQQYGVDEGYVREAFEEIEADWFESAKTVKVKKFGAFFETDFTLRQKQKRFLQYRGFYQEHIDYAVSNE